MVRTKFPLSKTPSELSPIAQNTPCIHRPRKLNPREEAFARYLFEGKTQIEARRLAGYSTNMTAKAQYENACFMANSLKISTRVDELREKAADDSVATILECEQTLTEIIRGRASDYLDDKGNRIIVTPNQLNTAAVKEVKTAYVMAGKGIDNESLVEVTELKLHNPIQAIESLAKLKKWNTEEKGSGDTYIQNNILNVNLNDMSDEDLQRIISGELVIDNCN